jgi:ribosomal protein L11 methyltransferase
VRHSDNLGSIPEGYDLILANITRDILIQSSKDIYRLLSPGGIAIYSGFIPVDSFIVKSYLTSLGVKQLKSVTKDNWACLVWSK